MNDMKRLLTIALAIVPFLGFAQDDMYFTPSKKAKKTAQQATVANVNAGGVNVSERGVSASASKPVVVDYHSSARDDDEYNRRYTYGGEYQNAGGIIDTALVASVDSVYDYAYEYDMEDPEVDYRFSRRLVRFHSPRYYSPYYWDLMYGYGAWDYLYDPYDPWYWHYGWGYGWSWGPWDCWYGGIWGWHSPYHWSYWGWGPGWGHTHYVVGGHYGRPGGHVGGVYRPRVERPAGPNGQRIRTSTGGRRTVASAGRGVMASTGSRTTIGTAVPMNGQRVDYNVNGRGNNRVSSGTIGRGNSFRNEGSRTVSVRGNVTGGENVGTANRTPDRSVSVGRRTISDNTRTVTTQAPSRSTNSDSYSRSTPTYSAPSRSTGSSSSFGGGGGFSGGGGGRSGGGRR